MVAIDCKVTEYQLTAIASCEVAGVAYGPGDSIRTASKRTADSLVASGAALHEGGELASEPVVAKVVKSRIKRTKK